MERPSITEYTSMSYFVRDMLRYRKATEKGFSVMRATSGLRRISPTLVSLVVKGQRALTLDRADEFSKLLNLNVTEKLYLRNWVGQLEGKDFLESKPVMPVDTRPSRAPAGPNLLNDWLNVYVKDFFHLERVQENPELVEKYLISVAPPKRVRRAIEFLKREGFLRRTVDGKLVLETRLAESDAQMPSQKIRQFHKGALQLAKLGIDLFPSTERLAHAQTLTLDEESYRELEQLIEDFSEKVKDFVARHPSPGQRLYQLIVNLTPVGGKSE